MYHAQCVKNYFFGFLGQKGSLELMLRISGNAPLAHMDGEVVSTYALPSISIGEGRGVIEILFVTLARCEGLDSDIGRAHDQKPPIASMQSGSLERKLL
jgi:hypothetical protein